MSLKRPFACDVAAGPSDNTTQSPSSSQSSDSSVDLGSDTESERDFNGTPSTVFRDQMSKGRLRADLRVHPAHPGVEQRTADSFLGDPLAYCRVVNDDTGAVHRGIRVASNTVYVVGADQDLLAIEAFLSKRPGGGKKVARLYKTIKFAEASAQFYKDDTLKSVHPDTLEAFGGAAAPVLLCSEVAAKIMLTKAKRKTPQADGGAVADPDPARKKRKEVAEVPAKPPAAKKARPEAVVPPATPPVQTPTVAESIDAAGGLTDEERRTLSQLTKWLAPLLA